MTPYIIRLKGLCIVEHLLTSPSNAVVFVVTKLTDRLTNPAAAEHGYTTSTGIRSSDQPSVGYIRGGPGFIHNYTSSQRPTLRIGPPSF